MPALAQFSLCTVLRPNPISTVPRPSHNTRSTEPALKHLDKIAANQVRNQVRIQVLQTVNNAKLLNTSKQENAAIQALHRDKSIHIMSADKGNAPINWINIPLCVLHSLLFTNMTSYLSGQCTIYPYAISLSISLFKVI